MTKKQSGSRRTYQNNADGKSTYRTYGKPDSQSRSRQNTNGKPTYQRKSDPSGAQPLGRRNADGKPTYQRKSDPSGAQPLDRRNANRKPVDQRKSDRSGAQSFDKRRAGGGSVRGKYDKPGDAQYKRARTEPGPDAAVQTEDDERPFLLIGRNTVREAVKSGRSIDRIEVLTEPDGSLREILSLARDRSLVIREVPRKRLDELCMPFGHGGKTANHQGIVAFAAGVEYCAVSDILSAAKERNENAFVVVLDGILDPHNLGSIIRSAECAGAHGVIIGKRRSASVTAATVKASAGATEHIKIARVVNIAGAIEELKRAGLWIAGADMGGTPMDKRDLTGPFALVIGGEGEGLSKLVSEKCDFLVSIPQYGRIASLNAGVAAGILLFEKKRQDQRS